MIRELINHLEQRAVGFVNLLKRAMPDRWHRAGAYPNRMAPRVFERWRERARSIKREAHAVYLASKDPRVPWYAKALAVCVLAYLFSPIDLIPDFIPVIGYLDDLIIVPAGLLLVIRLIPPEVMTEHRETARVAALERKPNWIAAGIILTIWLLLLGFAARFVIHRFPAN